MGYIYKIQHNLTGKTYVGLTRTCPHKRWGQHKRLALSEGKKYNPLHYDMHKLGIESFTFTILEECSISIVEEREVHWINELNSYEEGYNQMLPNSKRKGSNLMRKYH